MSGEAKHTPGPWKADHKSGWIVDARGEPVCQFWNRFDEDFQDRAANIGRIVQCVNAHDALVAALRSAKDALQQGFEDCGEDPECVYAQPLREVNAALATVTGSGE